MFVSTAAEPYLHIFSGDPAIDREKRRTDVKRPDDAPDDWQPPLQFDAELFRRTGDWDHMPLVPGGEPMKFFLKHLQGEQLALARGWLRLVGLAKMPEEQMCHRLAAMALESWDGIVRRNAKGHVEEVKISHINGDYGEQVHPALMAMLEQVSWLTWELGLRVVSEDCYEDPTLPRRSQPSPGS